MKNTTIPGYGDIFVNYYKDDPAGFAHAILDVVERSLIRRGVPVEFIDFEWGSIGEGIFHHPGVRFSMADTDVLEDALASMAEEPAK